MATVTPVSQTLPALIGSASSDQAGTGWELLATEPNTNPATERAHAPVGCF
jgi:hypothetical protein